MIKVVAAVLVISSTLTACAGSREATVQREQPPQRLHCPACGFEFEAPAEG